MIVAGSANPLLLASAAGGYNLTRSLRFRSSASAYLNRTNTTPTNNKIWTWSGWVKLGSVNTTLGTNSHMILQGFGSSSDNFWFGVYGERWWMGSSLNNYLIANAYARDYSAWYHVVLSVDTTQATASNRIKLYINNVLQTSAGGTQPTQNSTLGVNTAGAASRLGLVNGGPTGGDLFGDFYLAETIMVDGQQLTPSSFGEYSTTTGVWQPIAYSGTYGTNGFYLPFTDNSALTTSSNVGLGKDFSGNGNYWTTNNISITSGATYDSMTDVPTLTSATASNFAVINPLENLFGSTITVSQANLRATSTTTLASLATIALPSSGKYYFEYLCNGGDSNEVGLYAESTSEWRTYDKGGQKYSPAGYSSYGSSWTTNDLIGVSVDMTSGKLWFAKNGTWQASGDPAAGTNAAFTDINTAFATEPPFFYAGAYNGTHTLNFGQRPFAYTPPTGFVALNTFNLPTPTIGATASTQANKYFDATLWSGNGSTQSITNAGGFAPDFVWIKSRSGAYSHQLYDVIRGATNALYSNDTINTGVELNGLTAFNSNGFSVGNAVGVNASGASIVGWQWDAGGTGVTNTAGSITSTVSANTSSGFSVVTYTGNGSNPATIGHGLGVAPKMIITKSRSLSGSAWVTYHSSIGATKYLMLQSTSSAITDSNAWNDTSPSSTVFTVGSYGNSSSETYVAYCFSEVAGYSKFGSYTGNGSTDGTFVYTGFMPKYVMIKRTDTSGDPWAMYDTVRDPINVNTYLLRANTFNAESDDSGYSDHDHLSNGFKLRASWGGINASGGTYIYMAFAENPFKYSLAR